MNPYYEYDLFTSPDLEQVESCMNYLSSVGWQLESLTPYNSNGNDYFLLVMKKKAYPQQDTEKTSSVSDNQQDYALLVELAED